MKTLKIIIVAVIVAALGFGIYMIVKNKPETPEKVEIDIPEGCEGVVSSAQQLIDTRFNSVKDGEFDKLKSTPEDLQTFFVGQNIKSECMTSLNVIIRNRYLLRFIAMAKIEFSGKSWSNWEKIESMNKEFLKEETNNSDLKNFKKYCEEYRSISNYYYKVYGNKSGQSNQRPSSISDRWDYNNAQSLINNADPEAKKPVSSTTRYEKTRKNEVKKNLHEGHVAFIDALLEKGKENLKKNPTEENYRKIVNSLDDESSETYQYKNKAAVLYGVSSSEVNSNYNRWSNQLSTFHKIVEDDLFNIGTKVEEQTEVK